MGNPALFNFIIYNLLNSNMRSITIFHCWDSKMQHELSLRAADSYLFTQFVNLEKPGICLDDIEFVFMRHEQPALGVFVDMNCPSAEQFLSKSSRHRLFNQNLHWLVHDRQANLTNLRRIFGNANLSINADLTYSMPSIVHDVNEREESQAFTLYDVYNNGYQLGGKLNITIDREILCNRSACALSRFLSPLHLRTKYNNRIVVEDITMRVTTVLTERPLTLPKSEILEYLYSENNTFVDYFARYGFKLLMVMKDVLKCNFSTTYVDRWSTTATVGGTVGALISEEADLVSTPFTVFAQRKPYLDVVSETGRFRSVCIFRTPPNDGVQGGVFLVPFSRTVWLIFGVILLISAILLWCTFRIEHHRLRCAFSFMPSLLYTLLVSFGHACSQTSSVIPLSTGGRMAYFTLSLITFIMYNYYTSVVVSSLLGSPMKSKVKTLGQLADSSLEVGLEGTPFTYVYLNTSPLADVRRFVRNKIESKKPPQRVWLPLEEGVKRARDNPGFVYVFEASGGYVIVEKYYKPHEICDLNEVFLRPDKALHTHLNRNSTYKELIRLRETRMLETGVISKYRRYWLRERLNCFASNYVITVGMEYAAPLFFLLLCAYFFVLSVLCLEILHKKYSK